MSRDSYIAEDQHHDKHKDVTSKLSERYRHSKPTENKHNERRRDSSSQDYRNGNESGD